MEQQQQKRRNDTAEVWKGIGLAFLVIPVHSVVTGVLTGFASMASIRVSGGLLSTLVWLGWFLSVYLIFRNNGRLGIVRGLGIGLGLMALLTVVANGLLALLSW